MNQTSSANRIRSEAFERSGTWIDVDERGGRERAGAYPRLSVPPTLYTAVSASPVVSLIGRTPLIRLTRTAAG